MGQRQREESEVRAAGVGGAAVPVILALGLAAGAGLAAVLAGFGHRWGWWDFATGFTVLRWAVYAVVAAAVLAVLGALLLLWRRRLRAALLALPTLAVAAAVAAVPWTHLRSAGEAPPIHDITTDTESPPQFRAVLPLRGEAPGEAAYRGEAVARQQRRAYPDIGPLGLEMPPPRAFDLALAVARDMGWRIVASAPDEGRIEAVDTTFWFGFKDDVVVRLTPADGGTRVDVRSASRVGVSDLGTNAARIRAYIAELRARR